MSTSRRYYSQKNQYRRNNQKNRKKHELKEKAKIQLSEKLEKVWNKIKEIDKWREHEIIEITKEEGDAYIVAKAMSELDNGLPKSSQLRKYYDEVLRGSILLKKSNENIENVRRIIALLNPRIKYARSRPQRLVGDVFVTFIKLATNDTKFSKEIENFKLDYERFLNFFEALVGYYTYFEKFKERGE